MANTEKIQKILNKALKELLELSPDEFRKLCDDLQEAILYIFK